MFNFTVFNFTVFKLCCVNFFSMLRHYCVHASLCSIFIGLKFYCVDLEDVCLLV